MREKPQEASHICAILDDCAAVGDFDRLNQFIDRAARHVAARVPNEEDYSTFTMDDRRGGLWSAAMHAAIFRKQAISFRLSGQIEAARRLEAESEKALRMMVTLGRR